MCRIARTIRHCSPGTTARSPHRPPACISRPGLLASLADAGIATAGVTLHVGAGTFQPVRVDDTEAHTMHAEWGEVPAETASAVRGARAPAAASSSVGTTSLRLLETVARAHDGAVTRVDR